MLQLLNTEGNFPRTETYMVFENGNTFFSQDYQICRSGVECVGNSLPRKWCRIVGASGYKWAHKERVR